MIAKHIGRDVMITVDGRQWTLGRWDRRVWRDFLEWAKPRIPDPLDVAAKHIDRFPPHVQEALAKVAMDKATSHLSIHSPEVQELLGSLDGAAYVVYLLLKKNHPDVTEDQAFDVAVQVGLEEVEKKMQEAAGASPDSGKASDPVASPST